VSIEHPEPGASGAAHAAPLALPPEVACPRSDDDLLLTFALQGKRLLVARAGGQHVLGVAPGSAQPQLYTCEGAQPAELLPHPSEPEVALVAPERGVWRLQLGDGRVRRACGMSDLVASGWAADGTLLVVLWVDWSRHELLRWERGARGVSRPVTVARRQIPDLDRSVRLLGTPRWLTSGDGDGGQLALWPARAGDPVLVPAVAREGRVRLLGATTDGSRLLLDAPAEGHVLVVSAADGAVLLDAEVGLMDAVALDPAGRWLVGHTGPELLLWDLAAPEGGDPLARRIRLPGAAGERPVKALAIDPLGAWLAACDGASLHCYSLPALWQQAGAESTPPAPPSAATADCSGVADIGEGALHLRRRESPPVAGILRLRGVPAVAVRREDDDVSLRLSGVLHNPGPSPVTLVGVETLLRDSSGRLLDATYEDLDVSFRHEQELHLDHDLDADSLRAMRTLEFIATESRPFSRLHLRATAHAPPPIPGRGDSRPAAWTLSTEVLPSQHDAPCPQMDLAVTIRRGVRAECQVLVQACLPGGRAEDVSFIAGLRAADGALLARSGELTCELGPHPQWLRFTLEVGARSLRRARRIEVGMRGTWTRAASLGVYER